MKMKKYIDRNLLLVINMEIMRTKFFFSMILVFLIGIAGNAQDSFLKASGKQIVNGNGEEVILRGIGMGGWMLQEGYMLETASFAGTQHEIVNTIQNLVGEDATNDFYEAWRANYCQKKDVDSMAAWGFNSIRLPMHYNLFTLPIEDEPTAGQDTWLDTGFLMIDSLLEWCEANKIYLILDLHAAPGGQGKDANISDYDSTKPSLWESAENRRKTVALWKKLAERYANEPWIGGYDLLNEPNWDIDDAGNVNGCSCNLNTTLWSFYKEIIKAIRTVDSNHLVIIEGNCWGNNYNGLSNIKTFDSNLVLSFHKYWNYNDASSISGMITLRNTHNVPLWLGESGENSNTWFTNAISLAEGSDIGWAWWPYKKIGSVTGTVTIPKTTGWQNLLNYWEGTGSKPSEEQAVTWLMEQADQLKMENCIVHPDVTDAMFRQVKDKSPKPFKEHTAPGTIYATDYDLGANGYAYLDTDTANYNSASGTYTAWNSGYAYRNDGVDIEACTDTEASNGYNVGWTITDEWLLYTLDIEETAAYSIDVRYAAQSSIGKVHFELDGVSVTPQITLTSTGSYTTWGTKTITNVILKKGTHQLKLCVDYSGFNLNFFKIHSPTEIGALTPEILNIETDSDGSLIKLTSNLGYDLTSLPSTAEFTLTVNNSLKEIQGIYFDESNPMVLVLQTDSSIISTDKILLTYAGNSLKTSDSVSYSPFENREVVNNAPVYSLLPGKVQAEKFIYNNGLVTETCTDTGNGQDLGYAASGDYTDYNVYVSYNGLFRLDFRVASSSSGKFELRLVEDDKVTSLCSMTVSSTGGWQTWKTISAEVNLKQGKHVVRYYVVSGEFNFNWFSATTITSSVNLSAENNLVAIYDSQSSKINIVKNGGDDANYSITCFDISGRKMFTRQFDLVSNKASVSDVFLNKGLYLLCFESKGNSYVQKLRVQ